MSDELRLFAEYKLTKKDDGEWLDQSGCTWDSPEDWFFIDILGACGCGNMSFPERAVNLLRYFGTEDREPREFTEFDELLAHWFDSKGLTEHGGNVRGSWLLDEGYEILDVLNEAQKQA